MDNKEARINHRRETPVPSCSCTLMNNNVVYCDVCRLKPPITYKGRNYFCLTAVAEARYREEMKELKKNMAVQFTNNFLVEAKRENSEDTTDNNTEPTNGLVNRVGYISKEEIEGGSVGVDCQTNQYGNREPELETKDSVGEVFVG